MKIGKWQITIRNWKPETGNQKVETLSDEQILSALALTDQHPTWKALEQLLGEAIEEAVFLVSNHQTSEKPGLLTHTAGGIEALRDFRDRLRSLRTEALTQKP